MNTSARRSAAPVEGEPSHRLQRVAHAPAYAPYGLTAASGWSRAQAAYFQAYATSHYLVEPYIFTWDGVETCEIAPWEEDGQSWRGLAVTFPRSLDTHSRTQLYYFDDHDLLRRMDYQPEVLNSSPPRTTSVVTRRWTVWWLRHSGASTSAVQTVLRTSRGQLSLWTFSTLRFDDQMLQGKQSR